MGYLGYQCIVHKLRLPINRWTELGCICAQTQILVLQGIPGFHGYTSPLGDRGG